MRYLMTFSYDGSNYNGYQKQPNMMTVQSVIEDALFKINSNKYTSIHASGRTDSKVHALNQKAHFDLDKEIECADLKHALNSILSKDIYVKKVQKVDKNFHARFDVIKKEYIYKINIGEYNPLEEKYVMQYNKKLDIKKMKKALKAFKGEHNFASFTKASEEKESFDRVIYKASLSVKNDIITITFIGNGFLRYMVRNMVGLLIEIGSSKKSTSEVTKLLEIKDRTQAGITAKPNGLYLKNVYYSKK